MKLPIFKIMEGQETLEQFASQCVHTLSEPILERIDRMNDVTGINENSLLHIEIDLKN
jgi:hypothetical protein